MHLLYRANRRTNIHQLPRDSFFFVAAQGREREFFGTKWATRLRNPAPSITAVMAQGHGQRTVSLCGSSLVLPWPLSSAMLAVLRARVAIYLPAYLRLYAAPLFLIV